MAARRTLRYLVVLAALSLGASVALAQTFTPTTTPTPAPTNTPTNTPTPVPINTPTNTPTPGPTGTTTDAPTADPTGTATDAPTGTAPQIPLFSGGGTLGALLALLAISGALAVFAGRALRGSPGGRSGD